MTNKCFQTPTVPWQPMLGCPNRLPHLEIPLASWRHAWQSLYPESPLSNCRSWRTKFWWHHNSTKWTKRPTFSRSFRVINPKNRILLMAISALRLLALNHRIDTGLIYGSFKWVDGHAKGNRFLFTVIIPSITLMLSTTLLLQSFDVKLSVASLQSFPTAMNNNKYVQDIPGSVYGNQLVIDRSQKSTQWSRSPYRTTSWCMIDCINICTVAMTMVVEAGFKLQLSPSIWC